ncbi:MAG TPA: glycosyltransferase family 39 protein, partial [bacterium]|nr:glycosyltransferase family 39 protein [bacterium]
MSPAFRRVLLLSAALKIVLAIALANLEPRYDETEYAAFGKAIAEQHAEPVLWRAPGYQTFIAWGWTLAGGRFLGVRLLQALISIGATILVYRLGRRMWNERAGFAAGAFTAFYPTDVSFSHLLWSESLYGALVLVAFERLLASESRSDARQAALPAATAGMFLGAATLTRSVGAAWMAASCLWLLAQHRPARWRAMLAAAVFGGWAILVLPYSIQASARAGRFVLVDTNSGFNLWSGNNPRIPNDLPSMWCVGLPLENGSEFAGPLRR